MKCLRHFLKEKTIFTFNSKNQIKNGIYPHIIEIMYKLNAILGNKIFEEDPTSTRKEGEFDFVKDENSNLNSISNSNFKVDEMKVESGKKKRRREKKKEEEKKEEIKKEEEKKEKKK